MRSTLFAIAVVGLASGKKLSYQSWYGTHTVSATTTTAAPAQTYFGDGPSVPKCFVQNGRTIVHFDEKKHASWKCKFDVNSKTKCSCIQHPTHHKGKCRVMDHHNGKTLQVSGDCTASGHNAIHGKWGSWAGWGGAGARLLGRRALGDPHGRGKVR